jgi:peptidoglycan/LPS O-acetylase OafA/YrhL
MPSGTALPTHSNGRFEALDGLRGLAAGVVFAHHALVLLYGPLAGINEYHWPVRPQVIQDVMHVVPVAWVFNGTFAVSFFFVLSGFVLTRAMGNAPAPQRIAQLITARFLRLLPLVVFGTFVGYVMFDANVQHLDNLRYLTGSDSRAYIHPDLLQKHSLLLALKQAFLTIWQGSQAETLFDPPLWSIGLELKGSLLVYLLVGAFSQTPRRDAKYWVGLAMGLSLIGAASISFLAGMYFAERSRAQNDVLLAVRSPTLVALTCLTFIWASVHPWDRHLWLPLPFNIPELADACISTACSVFLMAAGCQLLAFQRFLTTRPIQFLGHCSYGLYVVHVPVLYFGTAPLFAWIRPHVGTHAAAVSTSLLLLAISIGAGQSLIKYIDGPTARITKQFVKKWLEASPPRQGAA